MAGRARGEQWARVALGVATAAAIVPVVVAAVRAVVHDWVPTSDNGISAILAWDVFSKHPPLVGVSSSLSPEVGRDIHNVGALLYDMLAVPIRLFGRGPGTAFSIALVNILAIVGIAWLTRRTLGRTRATVAVAATALLVWSMGSEMLYDPWYSHVAVLAYALFLVAAFCGLVGDPPAFVVMVVAGSFAVQCHLSYTVPVVGLCTVVLVTQLVRVLRERESAALRWYGATLVAGLVCWAQPIWDQLVHGGEGNFWALARADWGAVHHPAIADAVRVYGVTVALPPFWLPPSFGDPSFRVDGSGPPLALAVAGIVVLFGLLGVLGWRARGRGDTIVARAVVVALVALSFGVFTAAQTPMRHGFHLYYLRYLWPLSMFAWLVVGLGVIAEVRLRADRPKLRDLLAPVAAGVAVVAGVAALPTVDNGASSPAWSITAVNDLGPQVVAATRDQGTVLVNLPPYFASVYTGPALVGEMQDAGIPFVVEEEFLIRQFGKHYAVQPGEADVRLSVRGGFPDPADGEDVVATWSTLSSDDRRELERLSSRIAAVIERDGLEIRPGADDALDETLAGEVAGADADPEAFLQLHTLWRLVLDRPDYNAGDAVVDESAFPDGVLDRWVELARRRDVETLTVYLSSLERG